MVNGSVFYALADSVPLWTAPAVALLVGVVIMAFLIIHDVYKGD
jgi:cytochrome c-type biogenesis protein CcmH/NrfF